MPHTVTAREERTASKRRAAEVTKNEEKRVERGAALLAQYDASSRPDMPGSKAEQRQLRKELKARGEELCRVGAPATSATLRPSEVVCTRAQQADRRAFKTTSGWDEDDDS